VSARDALRKLAEQVSLLTSEYRRLRAENQQLRQQLETENETTVKRIDDRNRAGLRLVENSDSSLLDREQLIAKLEDMLEELAEIV